MIIVLFIFIQSMIPESKSARESQWFTESVINPLLDQFGLVADKDIVRKIAHSVEFCLLSINAFILWKPKTGAVLKTVFTGFTLAFLDETVQVFTGRGALVTDIWIDLLGVFIGTVVGWLIWDVLPKHSKEKETNKCTL